jgi:hypothetical protein
LDSHYFINLPSPLPPEADQRGAISSLWKREVRRDFKRILQEPFVKGTLRYQKINFSATAAL